MDLTVVIPTINSQQIIENNVFTLDRFLKQNKLIDKYEIIIAAQTSSDNTFTILKKIKKKSVKPIFIKPKGKGIGLTSGMKRAKYPWILMIDDDLPYNLSFFFKESEPNLKKTDIIIGSRYAKKLKHDIPIRRRIPSFCYRMLVKILFGLPQQDVQAGIKLIKTNVFQKTGFPKERGYIWDTELLYRAKRKKLTVVEIPIQLKQVSNKLRVRREIPKMLRDIIRLYLRRFT